MVVPVYTTRYTHRSAGCSTANNNNNNNNNSNVFGFRSLQPIIEGHAQLKGDQQQHQLFNAVHVGPVNGSDSTPPDKVIESLGNARRDGKSSAYGQGPTRRRLSSTFNEAFQPDETGVGGKANRSTSGKQSRASADAKGNGKASARGSGIASTSERDFVFGHGVHVNLQTGTPVPLTPLNDDGIDTGEVRAENNADDGAAVKTPHNRASAANGSKESRKRKSSSGCKRCNCKKSRCLKLYCECFAAGIFCDNCNCQVRCNVVDVATFSSHVHVRVCLTKR